MNLLSRHPFMEVVLRKLRNNVDMYATFNRAGNIIHYTEKSNPKFKRIINLAEGQRIFEDLYGSISVGGLATLEFQRLQGRKNHAAKKRGTHTIRKGDA